MGRPIELGTLQIGVTVKGGETVAGTPRMEFLQNNLREAVPLMEDGDYRWLLTMTVANAIRSNKTIQDYIDAGVIACPTCGTDRAVDKQAQVSACEKCKDGRYWNLMVAAH